MYSNSTPVRILFALLFLGTTLTSAYAQQWTSLFDGKTLKGWKQLNGQAKYEVKDGVIIGTAVPNTPNSFLTTEKDYGDFIFECELNVDEGLNSGIQIRSLSKPDYQNGRVHGYQVEVDATDRGYSGGIYDEARRGWLYINDLNEPAKKAFKRNNQWNKYRIEAIGTSLRTFVNGVEVAHVIDDMTASGFICLQVHSIRSKEDEGKQIRWRNVRIQTTNLKPSPVGNIRVENYLANHLSDTEKGQGWKLLFDGKSLENFRVVNSTETPTKRWKVEDGTVMVSKSDGSETGNDILTREEFKAFELSFDFQLSEGANSGVKYFINEKYDTKGKSGIGLEFQVLDDDKHPDAKMGVVGNRTIGSLYDLIPADKANKRDIKRPIGNWNKGRVVVYPDNTVEHYLNGHRVVAYRRGDNIYKALVARSKYKDWENFGMGEKGPILLQDHGDTVKFRSLKIRELSK
ncbi:MAG: DUF1080 domain-containing protein [Spirosomaceae bacterium]|jgi:hypothetical protein|nr:DUF1080 domain-containing protein [Spirosomataceae bacterium]